MRMINEKGLRKMAVKELLALLRKCDLEIGRIKGIKLRIESEFYRRIYNDKEKP